MLSFILRRILYSIPLLFVISIIIFFIIELPPGDYATWYVSQTKALANITQEQALELTIMLREKYGLNEPLIIRYFNWIKNIVLNLIGKHNILNSVAAICVCLNLGIKIKIIKKALFKFSGVQRRMTKLFEKNENEFYDDYAHHPTEIHSVLEGVKKVSNKKKNNYL